MRKRGRPRNDRLRAMRFALWAHQVPMHLLTVKQISGLLDLNKSAAANWRRDLLNAMSPVEIEGVPSFLTPAPRGLPTTSRPAATDQAPPTTRS